MNSRIPNPRWLTNRYYCKRLYSSFSRFRSHLPAYHSRVDGPETAQRRSSAEAWRTYSCWVLPIFAALYWREIRGYFNTL